MTPSQLEEIRKRLKKLPPEKWREGLDITLLLEALEEAEKEIERLEGLIHDMRNGIGL